MVGSPARRPVLQAAVTVTSGGALAGKRRRGHFHRWRKIIESEVPRNARGYVDRLDKSRTTLSQLAPPLQYIRIAQGQRPGPDRTADRDRFPHGAEPTAARTARDDRRRSPTSFR